MEYAVLTVSNGNNSITGEHITSKAGAIVLFHSTCAALWNEPSVLLGACMIVDEKNRLVDGYHEVISHSAAAQSE